MASSNHSFCKDLPIYNNNKTFCGITNVWKPRIVNYEGILICVTLIIIACLLTLYDIYQSKDVLRTIYKSKIKEYDTPVSEVDTNEDSDDTKQKEMINMSDETASREDSNKIGYLVSEATDNVSAEKSTSAKKRYWNCMKKEYHMFTIIILPILMLLWNVVDAAIDVSLFYELETRQKIHEDIYRNVLVNDSILGFAVFGCAKMVIWIIFVEWLRRIESRKKKNHKGFKSPDTLSLIKLSFVIFTFILEDGPELFLEYFYVEKYLSKQLSGYLLARDIILSMISLHMIVYVIWFGKTGLESLKKELARSKFGEKVKSDAITSYWIIIAGNVFVGLLFFFRAGGAGYQCVTGKLERSCFAVTNGSLLQTPFAVGWMREVDYVIFVLSGVSMFFSLWAVFSLKFFFFDTCWEKDLKNKRINQSFKTLS